MLLKYPLQYNELSTEFIYGKNSSLKPLFVCSKIKKSGDIYEISWKAVDLISGIVL
jgi:hypothetical protein